MRRAPHGRGWAKYIIGTLYSNRAKVPLPVNSVRMLADLPEEERPRERLLKYGASALTSTELLAILLNTGMRGESVMAVADRILREHGGFIGLMKLDANELAKLHGIGPAKATKLKATMEIANRVIAANLEARPRIVTPDDVMNLIGLEMAMLEEEQLRVLLLNTRNELTGMKTLYQGSSNQVPVRVSEIYREAVRANAMAIVVVHNHPSGDPTPSAQDIELTLDLEEAGRLLGCMLMDHMIIGQGRAISMKRLGLGFKRK